MEWEFSSSSAVFMVHTILYFRRHFNVYEDRAVPSKHLFPVFPPGPLKIKVEWSTSVTQSRITNKSRSDIHVSFAVYDDSVLV